MMNELASEPTIDPDSVPDYLYRAQVLHIVDGDTFDVRIDLGFETYIVERVRTRDIDTREIHFVPAESEEFKRGTAHTDTFASWVQEAENELGDTTEWPFYVYSKEYNGGAYGRVIGDIWSRYHEEWASRYLYNKFDDVCLYE